MKDNQFQATYGAFVQKNIESKEKLTSIVMVNPNLGKHCIVLNLGFSQGWTIVGNDDQFTYQKMQNQF